MISLVPLDGIPEIGPGEDLGALISEAAQRSGVTLSDDDVLVVTQKVVSKAEGRTVELATVNPRPEAIEWASRWGKDPRQVELVLSEAADVVRMADGGLIIARTRHGWVCANAGVDVSNVGGGDVATLLPEDADASARRLRERIGQLANARPAIVISDSFGRPWRQGIVNVAIGAAGLETLLDLRGIPDAQGRPMRATVIAVADELASAADLAGGKVEQRPVVAVRGYRYVAAVHDRGAAELVMPRSQDLFP